ncbi:MAG: family 43 glycosylhydrolase [Balneolaceae bacterium]|nr:family 43 glycosylhydrolase [Balneolaceae bacterium]
MKKLLLPSIGFMLFISCSQPEPESQAVRAGNPVIEGWYADPEGIVFNNEYWIFPTYSDHYGEPDTSSVFTEEQLAARSQAINEQYLIQTFFDAFSSKDLVNWEKHSHVLDIKDVKWASYSMWAPSIIQANDQYYLFFSANDIQSNEEYGGIGVAVADQPEGPYKDALGEPLIDEFHNGAQPMISLYLKITTDSFICIMAVGATATW